MMTLIRKSSLLRLKIFILLELQKQSKKLSIDYNPLMSKQIFCEYYKRDLDQMERPPYPGSLGERIHLNISKEAWDLWLQHQTMLINENRLSMVDPSARSYLQNEMIKFLFEGGSEKPKEYIPPTE